MSNATQSPELDIERLARKRAGAKLGWYIHATVFIAVNLLLWAITGLVFPSFAWGIGLAIHGAVVFLRTSGLSERMVQRERDRLQVQRDPW